MNQRIDTLRRLIKFLETQLRHAKEELARLEDVR
jgi:hypothetical protein